MLITDTMIQVLYIKLQMELIGQVKQNMKNGRNLKRHKIMVDINTNIKLIIKSDFYHSFFHYEKREEYFNREIFRSNLSKIKNVLVKFLK